MIVDKHQDDGTSDRFERELAILLAAEGESAQDTAEPPSSARVWWRAQMRARQEAAAAANRPMTVVHALAIACGVGLLLGLGSVSLAWLRGTSGSIAGAVTAVASAAAPITSVIGDRWIAVSLTTMVVTVVVLSIAAAALFFADE